MYKSSAGDGRREHKLRRRLWLPRTRFAGVAQGNVGSSEMASLLILRICRRERGEGNEARTERKVG